MRAVVHILVSLILTAAVGLIVCRILKWDVHTTLLIAAAIAALLASVAGLVPMLLTRGASQPAVAQAALVGTMVHLFACVTATAVGTLGSAKLGIAFTYWLLAFYGASLTALAAAYVSAVRKAPMAPRH